MGLRDRLGILAALGMACLVADAAAQGPRLAAPVHEVYQPPVMERVASRAPIPPPRPLADASLAPPATAQEAAWVPGYWDYDSRAEQFLWVGGVWRVPPPGRTWIEGFWTGDLNRGYERSAGYWSFENRADYRVEGPPASAPADEPGPSPGPGHFYVTGHYEPGERDSGVHWKPGYWTREQPGWSWIAAAWLDRPFGWVFQPGYWVYDKQWRYPPINQRQRALSKAEAWERLKAESLARASQTQSDPASASAFNQVTSALNNVLAEPATGGPRGAVSSFGDQPGPMGGGSTLLNPMNATRDDTRPTPAPRYYIGRSAPGSTFPSYSPTPTAVLGQSSYIGRSAPGSFYESYSSSPSSLPGQSAYIGQSAPGSTYATYSTSGVNVNGYGYGPSPPGVSGGQAGGSTGP